MSYVLNHNTPHKQALIELINHDNSATIVEPFTDLTVDLSAPVASGLRWKVTVSRKSKPTDKVDITYKKLVLADYVTMDEANNDFAWYDEANWGTLVEADAIAAFKAAAVRATLNPNVAFDSVAVRFEDDLGTKKVHFDVVSYVWETTVTYVLPVPAPAMNEEVTNTEPDGF